MRTNTSPVANSSVAFTVSVRPARMPTSVLAPVIANAARVSTTRKTASAMPPISDEAASSATTPR